MKKLILSLFLISILFTYSYSATIDKSAWKYVRPITYNVAVVSGTVTNYPALVYIDTTSISVANFAKFNADGSDIRFTDSADTILDHELVSFKVNTTSASIIAYISISSITYNVPLSGKLFYGNSSAVSISTTAVWNGKNYTRVLHCNDNSTAILDSVSGVYAGTATGDISYGGKLGLLPALTYAGVNGYVDFRAPYRQPYKLAIGLISDTHNTLNGADTANIGDTRARVSAFATAMNTAGANWVVSLGDNIHNLDADSGVKVSSDITTNITTLASSMTVFTGSIFCVLGNHDVAGSTKSVVVSQLGMPSNYYYVDYATAAVRCIFLDCQYNTNDTDIAWNSADYSQGHIPDAELTWLTATLASAKALNYRAVIFTHQSLRVTGTWGISNSSSVVTILENSGMNPLVVGAHYHTNTGYTTNGIHYVSGYTPSGTADATPNNDWQMLTVNYDNSIDILGYQSCLPSNWNMHRTSTGTAKIFQGEAAGTMEQMINFAAAPSGNQYLYWESNGAIGYARFTSFLTSAKKITVGGRDSATGTFASTLGTTVLSTGVPHSIQGEWNSAGDFIHLYIDGQKDEGASKAIGAFINVVPAGERLGAPDTGGLFKGKIGEVRTSNVLRGQNYAATVYNNLKAPDKFITLGAESSTAINSGLIKSNYYDEDE